jgi:cellobiose-specific phosphotransferase system component IIA
MADVVVASSAVIVVLTYGAKTIHDLVQQRRNGGSAREADRKCPTAMTSAIQLLAENHRSQTEILREIAAGQREISERTAVLVAIHGRREPT